MRNTLILAALLVGTIFTPVANSAAEPTRSAPSSTGIFDQKAFDDGFGKLPTNISSDSLTFNAKNRIFAYQGNVIVTQGDMRLTAKSLEGNYNEQNQLQKLTAKGDVFITKQDIQASGQVAAYDAVASIVTLTENPQLQQKESVLRADRIKIFLNENRSQAEGDVRVTFVNTKGMGLKPEGSSESPLPASPPKQTPPNVDKSKTAPKKAATAKAAQPKKKPSAKKEK